MIREQLSLDLHKKIIVDLFAGGGGMSIAIESALGRCVDVAVNHDEDAISMHEANHPQTRHYHSDVFEVCPREACGGRPVGLLHLSPDCTHHSQAAGGQPRNRKIRALSWVGIRWAGQVRPDVITLENVKQIRNWGPLVAKRCAKTGRVIKLDGTVAAPGERVPLDQQHLVPDPRRAGKTWQRFKAMLASMGYAVEEGMLMAADYGAATSRDRLFLIARCDGSPIVWPQQTHAAIETRKLSRWRHAADFIDFSLPCPSIFGRKRELAEATKKRIAKGMVKFVLESPAPFIVPIAHFNGSSPVHSCAEPLRTITAFPRGGAFSLVTPYLVQANGGSRQMAGRPADMPLTTITTTGSQQQLVTAHLATLRRNCVGRPLSDPLPVLTAGAKHHAPVSYQLTEADLNVEDCDRALRCAAFLISYYGTDNMRRPDAPLATVTTKDRLALVTVWIAGNPWVIVDIGLRMLTPRELYSCQGFPANYIIERGHDGRAFTKEAQVRMVGNSVSPLPAEEFIRVNCGHLAAWTTEDIRRRRFIA